MKKMTYSAAIVLFLTGALPTALFAAQDKGGQWFQINNRIRFEYDDNVFQTDDDEESSFKIIEEVELFVNFNLAQTFVSVRYRPSFVWWENRPGDESDYNHDIDFVFNHSFTPRLSLSVKDTFRIGELPELIERGTTFRENNDFVYNTVNGTATYRITPNTRAELAGRFDLLRYDDDDVADRQDYNIYTVGANLRHQLLPETALVGEFRYETVDFTDSGRDSDGIQVGGAVEQIFSPNLLGNARVGWQHKELDNARDSENDTPFADAVLTFLPSPATRISGGAGFQQVETDVFPFTNQERFRVFGSLAHDLTARLAWFVAANFITQDLDADEALADSPPPVDGDEDIFQLSARLIYRLNRANTIEAGWQFTDLDSDVRENYTRNRLNLGWKLEL